LRAYKRVSFSHARASHPSAARWGGTQRARKNHRDSKISPLSRCSFAHKNERANEFRAVEKKWKRKKETAKQTTEKPERLPNAPSKCAFPSSKRGAGTISRTWCPWCFKYIESVRERVCFVMIEEAKRRSLLLFSRVGFFVLFCFSFSVDVLVHFCSPKKNKISCWINRH
jgi:hypothetical protein